MLNYRPISILSVISKIIESIFSENKLFSTQQYGFRPNRSTKLAALELIDRNIENMNKSRCPINIYVDLSKALDSLDHHILLSNPNLMDLMTKLLIYREDQFVQLGNIKSNHHLISRGIPQRSVIGSLLFNAVMNDLTSATAKFDHVMYADDTTLISTLENFGPTNNAKELEQNINDKISKVVT